MSFFSICIHVQHCVCSSRILFSAIFLSEYAQKSYPCGSNMDCPQTVCIGPLRNSSTATQYIQRVPLKKLSFLCHIPYCLSYMARYAP